jgi:hypothetical protein
MLIAELAAGMSSDGFEETSQSTSGAGVGAEAAPVTTMTANGSPQHVILMPGRPLP